MGVLLWCACGLALLPTLLILWNLTLVRRPTAVRPLPVRVSVLIPARNEARNVAAAIDSVLATSGTDFELLVLDDHSTDDTRHIVEEAAARDARVRLLPGRPLPAGACGKPFACAQLADVATGEVLVFMDADVRLRPHALAALAAELERTGAALVSGVPFQVTGTLGEKLIVPLIHFVLLGFLPLALMRALPGPAFGAACGQLIVAKREAYVASGGHAAILESLHDGLRLARQFRARGWPTDIADFTDVATCRMYRNGREVLEGFAKNAHEGLGSRRGIVPWTLLLLGGQSLPLMLLPWLDGARELAPALTSVLLAYAGRGVLAVRFRQSRVGVLLHPFGVAALVAIQWYALARRALKRPVPWKNRAPAVGPG